jgi:hypothetical protein
LTLWPVAASAPARSTRFASQPQAPPAEQARDRA